VKRPALAVLALGIALPLLAQPQGADGKWWKRPRIAAQIGLTPEQSGQIEKIFVKTRPRLIDLKADLEKKQFALQSAMEDKAAERGDVEKKIDAVEEARKELQKARALMILDIKQVLKPEQWERLLQLQQEARERRREMRDQTPDGRAAPRRPDPTAEPH
jgi:Spy/CpxP family protein refolding chaperone